MACLKGAELCSGIYNHQLFRWMQGLFYFSLLYVCFFIVALSNYTFKVAPHKRCHGCFHSLG